MASGSPFPSAASRSSAVLAASFTRLTFASPIRAALKSRLSAMSGRLLRFAGLSNSRKTNDGASASRFCRSAIRLHSCRAVLFAKSEHGRRICGIRIQQYRSLVFAEVRMVYVAGPITGRKNYNREAFAAASDKLRLEGWRVFNPAAANLEGDPIPKIMAYCLSRVCECDAIAMLPGWWRSGGARIEWMLARYLKLKIIYL